MVDGEVVLRYDVGIMFYVYVDWFDCWLWLCWWVDFGIDMSVFCLFCLFCFFCLLCSCLFEVG